MADSAVDDFSPDNSEIESENAEKVLILRSYQLALVNICCKANTIIFLPTGSGKTCIAVHTLKQLGEKLEGSLEEGGKRALFMVPTKALVYQQAKTITEQTPFRVAQYTGDMGVDYWPRATWNEEINTNQILVMTPTIMQNLLASGYMGLDVFALVIIDECHNGVEDHAFRAVMRELQNVAEESRPRIIGLTATLLNRTVNTRQVYDEIQSLERTFHGQIATCDELADVLKFSANPSIRMLPYACGSCEGHIAEYMKKLQDECLEMVSLVDQMEGDRHKAKAPSGYSSTCNRSIRKIIGRSFKDIETLLEDLGTYGGSVAVLLHTLEYEQKRILSETEIEMYVYSQVTTTLNLMRSALMRIMDDNDGPESILLFSSPKVKTLLDLLREDQKTIIFTQRRTMAITLTHILRKLSSTEGSRFEFLKPAFIVGGRANPLKKSNLMILESKWQQKTLKQFATGDVNTLVATSVVEEGVDIPTCNMVVRFDVQDLHYRSFVQCKGRARSKTGEFVILVKEAESSKILANIQIYKEIEETLYKLLLGKNNQRDAPTQESIEEDVYQELVEPYYVAGPDSSHVTGITAIPCVSRYCGMLPQDLFSQLCPAYFTRKEGGKTVCAVQLPIVSPVRGLVEGLPMPSMKLAKRSAFVAVVRELHLAGELSDELKPKLFSANTTDYMWLFPHYPKDDNKVSGESQAGTKHRRQIYDVKSPDALSGCLPIAGSPCFLHVVTFTPAYPEPTVNRRRVFHQLLSSPATYAILSTKQLPQVCEFPLYMSVGEVTCQLQPNSSSVCLSDEQLRQVGRFHLEMFSSVIDCMKSFLVLSKRNAESAFYIVPVKMCSGKFDIDWSIVSNIEKLTSKMEEPPEKIETLNTAVVSPYYRGDEVIYYIVTNVCEFLSPMSPFPESAAQTYFTYFENKYNKTIKDLTQPLLEVKKMPTLSSCFMRPHSNKSGGIRSRRKMQADGEDLDEILVPELCNWFHYPSALWLKAELLPTALHRITQLLFMHELHATIAMQLGDGRPVLTWAPLSVIPDSSNVETEEPPANRIPVGGLGFVAPRKKVGREQVPAAALWDEKNEPMNIMNCMDKVADCDLRYFAEFTNREIVDSGFQEKKRLKRNEGSSPIEVPRVSVLKLHLIDSSSAAQRTYGPELHELLAATTAKSANDIVNLERLETLGDSFLKFAASLFLFREFPSFNEGQLTTVKSQLVSNRNLLYCGQAKGLPSFIQFQEFVAAGEWVPPLCEVPPEILQMLKTQRKDPGALYSMCIPVAEQLDGHVQPKTLLHMRAAVEKSEVLTEELLISRSLSYLLQKVLPDKSVADCVEAILGTYVLACGLDGALKLLNWFDILPVVQGQVFSTSTLLHNPAPSPLLLSSKSFQVNEQLSKINYRDLECMLNYQFKDKAFLLQALTHPSSAFHRATDCYQRLEFLGDAVLDFLVTCFIYQEAPDLNPGQISILRSALVNNTTFGCLSVRYDLYRYMLSYSGALTEAIAAFVALQESRGHVVDEAVQILLEEADVRVAESVEVPKALGDLFQSLAGAIFLDSGNSLETVWNVYYPLMKKELDAFKENTPRNSVALLHELAAKSINVTATTMNGTVRVRVDLTLPSGEMTSYYGFGPNKFEAKRSAAKLALRAYYGQTETTGAATSM